MAGPSSISNIWAQRELGVDLSKNLTAIGASDIKRLCDHSYPFIQLINPNALFDEEMAINIIPASTGWSIHDYGEAISASSSHATIASQINTVAEIAGLIANKGWEEVEVIDGTLMMKRCMLIETGRYGLILKGHVPSMDDQRCLSSLKKQYADNWKKQPANPKLEAGGIAGAE